MRELTQVQRNLLAAQRLEIHTRVTVYRFTLSDTTGVEVTNLQGFNWFIGAKWSFSLDTFIPSGTVTLRRRIGSLTLAPLMEASILNRDDLDQFFPRVYSGRRIKIHTAITAPGVIPGVGDWKEVVHGKIDRVDWGKREDVVSINFSGIEADLSSTQIKPNEEFDDGHWEYSDDDAGLPVETVIQQMLDDHARYMGVEGLSPVLLVPTSPGWYIKRFKVDPGNLYEAIRNLALQIGWDLRFRYVVVGGVEDYRLVLYNPNRDTTVADTVIGPNEYEDVTDINIDDSMVRNQIDVTYYDEGLAKNTTVRATSEQSILDHGIQYMHLGLPTSDNINTWAEAEYLANTVLSDLKDPPVAKTISMIYFWPVEINDVLEFPGNGEHYDTTKHLAVASVEHSIEGKDGTTTIATRGKPAAASSQWIIRASPPPLGGDAAVLQQWSRRNPVTGVIEIYAEGNSSTQGFALYMKEHEDDPWPTLPDDIQQENPYLFVVNPGWATFLYRLVPIGTGDGIPVEDVFVDSQIDALITATIKRDSSNHNILSVTRMKPWVESISYGTSIVSYGAAEAASPTAVDFVTDTIEVDLGLAVTSQKLYAFIRAFSQEGAAGDPVQVLPIDDTYVADAPPRVELGSATLTGGSTTAAPVTANVSVTVVDPQGGDGGTLKVWTAPASTSTPVGTGGSPDATISISGFSKRTDVNIGTSILTDAIQGKVAYVEYQSNKTGYNTGKLAIAWGGYAWALKSDGDLKADIVDTINIKANSITAAKIAAGTITADKIAAGTITANEISAGAITADKIAAGAITADKIAAGAITADKIAAGAITADKITAGTITANEIAAGTITAGKIAAGTITATQIAADTITAGNIAANAITTSELSAGAVTAAKIAAGTITATEIAAGTITGDKFVAGTITGDKISTATITGDRIVVQTITGGPSGQIASTTITSTEIATGAVTATKVAADAITTNALLAGSVTASKIAAGAVTAAALSVTTLSSITSDLGTVTAGSLSDSTGKFSLNLNTPLLTIIDNQATPITRIRLGKLSTGTQDYGIEIYDQNHTLILGATGLGTAVVGTSNLVDLAITGAKLNDGSVATAKLADAAITAVKIGANQVTLGKLGSGAVDTAALAALAVTTAKIAAGAVTNTEIGALAVDSAKLASAAVTTAKIAAGAVTTTELGALAVTNAKVAANAIDTANILTDAVTTIKIAAGQITTAKIAAGAVTTTELAALAVTNAKVAANAIDTSNIVANAITTGKFAAGAVDTAALGALAVTTAKIASGAVTTTELAALAVTNAKVAANAIDTTNIVANAVTTAKVAAGAITNTELGALAVDSAKLAAGAVTTAKIASLAVTTAELAAAAVTGAKIAANTITAANILAGTISATELAARSVTASKLVITNFDNMCQDPSLENGAPDWVLQTGWSVTSSVARTGSKSLAFTATTGAARSPLASCTPGEMYYGEGYMRGSSGSSGTFIGIRITFWTAAGAELLNVNGAATVPGTGAFVLGSVTATAPSTAAFVNVEAVVIGNTGGTWYADDFYLRRMVGGELIIDGSVTASEIAAGSVTTAKLAAGAVTANEIAANTITAAKIVAGTITTAEIASGTITAGNIAALTLTAGVIAAGAITTAKIAASAITATEIATDAVTATKILAGSVTTAKIAAGAVTANEIAANTITAAKIAAGTITTTEIASGTITAGNIAALTLTAGVIASGAITTAKIAASAVTANEIAANAITAGKIAANSVWTANMVVASFDNLAPDPGFELNDVNNWTLETGWSIDNSSPRSGGFHAKHVGSGDYGLYPQLNKHGIKVTPGEKYYFEAGIKTVGVSGSVLLCMLWYNSPSVWNSTEIAPISIPNNSGAYNVYGYTFTAPANATLMLPLIFVQGKTAGTVYTDDWYVRRALAGALVVDGTITGAKLVADTITSNEIAANAITVSELAAGSVSTAKIAAGAVTANEIAANTITASNIAAGAITASKLLISGPGAALNQDPGMTDIAAWNWIGGDLGVIAGISDGKVGGSSLRSYTGGGNGSWHTAKQGIPVDPTKTYRVRCWARASTGHNGTFYLAVDLRQSDDSTQIAGDGALWFYPVATSPTDNVWTEYSGTFGAGTARTIPSSGKIARPAVILNYLGTAGWIEVQDLRLEEVIPSALIQDGAIIAAKISAGAVTAGKIAALSIAAGDISAGAITTAKIAAGAVTANEIAAGTITATNIASGAITASKLLIMGGSGAINNDPMFKDPAVWVNTSGTTATFTTVTDGPAGATVMRSTGTGASWMEGASTFDTPVKSGIPYKLSGNVRRVGANGVAYFRVVEFDGSGNYIQETAAGLEGLNPATSGTWYFVENTFYLHTNTRFVRIRIILNYAGSAGYYEAQNVRFEPMVVSALIADGAITTAKVDAGAITAAKISVTSLSAIAANIGVITAGQLRNATDTAGIAISGGPNVGWQNYLDIAATGANNILKVAALSLQADGGGTYSDSMLAMMLVFGE